MGEPAEALAAWLKARMAERGLGQRQLARFARVSPTTIGRILRMQGAPRVEIVVLLAEYFGAEPAAVLAEVGLSALDAAPPDARAEAADLLRRLYALAPADRAFIMKQVNEILDFLERAPSDAGEGSLPRRAARGLTPRAVREARARQ